MRIAVSVNAIVGAPFSQQTVRPPIKPPETTDVKKPGSPCQDNRVKISSCFLNVSGLIEMS
ncbi:hypothetical protein EYY89_18540 [Hafnia paralvei]|uniref:Uncharacterized protein n=1 Tax=Hafnia paralvei TaxID=546367 RepID=A0A4V6MSS1_9GAMM|nr:hypothetical protein EYY89_18540 [Hafnia paralvei]